MQSSTIFTASFCHSRR